MHHIPGRNLPALSAFEATLRAARQGDLRAINRLVHAHQAFVYNLAYWLLGEDTAAQEATQAAFVGAMRALAGYSEGSFRVWVLGWLVRACAPVLNAGPPPLAGPGRGLPGCLTALPPAQRLVLALVDIAGLDYAQTGLVLGLPAAQVVCTLSAARQALLSAGNWRSLSKQSN